MRAPHGTGLKPGASPGQLFSRRWETPIVQHVPRLYETTLVYEVADATLAAGVAKEALAAPPAARMEAAEDLSWRKKSMAGSH
jgi:hypothetical protein